jgi:hypothetical protein
MTSRFIKFAMLLLALSLPLGAHAQQAGGSHFNDLRSCPPGTQSYSFPNGNGYWCVPYR